MILCFLFYSVGHCNFKWLHKVTLYLHLMLLCRIVSGFVCAGRMIIQEPMEVLIARADKFVINREVLDRLQETFAAEILSIALIRSQNLLLEKEQQQLQSEAQGSSSPALSSQGSNSPKMTLTSSTFSSHFASLASLTNSSSKKGVTENGAGSIGAQSTDTFSTQQDDAGDSINTGLASLSQAERRKVVQVMLQLRYIYTVRFLGTFICT